MVLSCTVCERIFKNADDVKKHVAEEHKQNQDKSHIVCRHYRNGNCFNGERCEYSHVGFVRNSSQNKTNSGTTKKASTCRHGDACSWLARGACGFFHRGVGVQKPHQNTSQQRLQENRQPREAGRQPRQQRQENKGDLSCPNGSSCIHLERGSCNYGGVFYHVRHKQQQQQQQGREDSRLCWEDENCKRISCHFTHPSLKDFPNLPEPRRPHVMRKQNQGRSWN